MPDQEKHCLLITDFTTGTLASIFENDAEEPKIASFSAPFSQTVQTLLDSDAPCWEERPDVTFVWSRPESVLPSFAGVLQYESVPFEELKVEVERFVGLLTAASTRTSLMLVATWVAPFAGRGLGMLDMTHPGGISGTLLRLNALLAEAVGRISNLYLLDSQRWLQAAGGQGVSPKLWYMAKSPFGNAVYADAVKDIKAAVRGVSGKARKLVIVDLDDTLWGGIVGDIGWENLTLGGHDPIGEAHADLQRELKALTNRGVVLGIVSKNEQSVALEAITKHPEMILRESDFAGWKINWQDKAQNIVALVEELNLGLESVVFIDDSRHERARVREALPEVLVPEWPVDKMLYADALRKLRCFDSPVLSVEDADRTASYVSERKRSSLLEQAESLSDWLNSLETVVTVESLNDANLARTAQLLNKTNQMNLSTRRMTAPEYQKWANDDGHRVFTFRVADRFGDAGLTGIASLKVNGNKGSIVDFVLSCRVMGRKVEEALVHFICAEAGRLGVEQIEAVYLPTERNKPCREFWLRSGFETDDDVFFRWNPADEYALPPSINLKVVRP